MVQSQISYIAFLSSSSLRYDRVVLLGFLKAGITWPCGLWLSGFIGLLAGGVLASQRPWQHLIVCSVTMPTPLASTAHVRLMNRLPRGVMGNDKSTLALGPS